MRPCVHAYSHTAAVRLFSDSDRVLLAVGRETSGPASALRAPAGSGSGMMHIHTSHPGMHPGRIRRATPQRRRACSTAGASSAPGRYRPERRPQLRARAWDCGLSGSLCRPPAAAGATLLSRSMAAGTVVVREAACILNPMSRSSKVCNAKCIKCAYPFIVHPIVPLLAALLSVLGCPRPHHPPQTPRRHRSPQPR